MKLKKSEPLKTVLTIVLGFTVVFAVTHGKWAMWVALLTGVAGLSSSYIADRIDWLWMKLTHILGLIMPNILLTVIFYLFLFPIAIMARVFGRKDQLMLRKDYKTTFITVNKSFEKSGFEKAW